jgi:hypothetical protein
MRATAIGNWSGFERRRAMKNRFASLAVLPLLAAVSNLGVRAIAYDNYKAHPAINVAIVDYVEYTLKNAFPATTAIDITVDKTMLKGPALTNAGFFEASTGESDKEFRALDWIRHGGFSADEPELAAAVRHFYDPLRLSGQSYLTNRGTYWEGVYSLPFNPGIDAIEWALGDTEKGSANNWTLMKGKDYLVLALTETDAVLRNGYLAKAFRCLGEVLHNTGDMGCPPHTRNDSHAAPLGYDKGWALGSPDPYEELFDPAWASSFSDGSPDPELKAFFENATTVRSIDEKLAEFTNANFFTAQTINGLGRTEVKPVNEECIYPYPRLEDLDYRNEEFTYYKDFQSGRRVKMCKDKGYFRSRTYPFIDKDCVESQARELVPDILCAGAHIVRLFIPKLSVEITTARPDGTLKGTISSARTDEYPIDIAYAGKVSIINDRTDSRISEVDCGSGYFDTSVSGLKNGDRIVAEINFGGVRVRSAVFEVSDQNLELTQYNVLWIMADGNMIGFDKVAFVQISNNKEYNGTVTPLIWIGTSFSATYRIEKSVYGGIRVTTGSIRGTVDGQGTRILTLDADQTVLDPWTSETNIQEVKRISLRNLDLVPGTFGPICELSGTAFRTALNSVYFYEFFPFDPDVIYQSADFDWNNAGLTPAISVWFEKK